MGHGSIVKGVIARSIVLLPGHPNKPYLDNAKKGQFFVLICCFHKLKSSTDPLHLLYSSKIRGLSPQSSLPLPEHCTVGCAWHNCVSPSTSPQENLLCAHLKNSQLSTSAAVSLSLARLSHLGLQVKLQQVQVQEMFPPPPENSSRGNDEILIVPEDDLSTDCKKKVLSCFWCFTQESVELCSQCGLVASCDKHWKQHR